MAPAATRFQRRAEAGPDEIFFGGPRGDPAERAVDEGGPEHVLDVAELVAQESGERDGIVEPLDADADADVRLASVAHEKVCLLVRRRRAPVENQLVNLRCDRRVIRDGGFDRSREAKMPKEDGVGIAEARIAFSPLKSVDRIGHGVQVTGPRSVPRGFAAKHLARNRFFEQLRGVSEFHVGFLGYFRIRRYQVVTDFWPARSPRRRPTRRRPSGFRCRP